MAPHELPKVHRVGFDWGRLTRWSAFAALVLFLWLLAPTVRCSWAAFKGTPLSTIGQDEDGSSADKQRVLQGKTFVENVIESTTVCYARTPLLGQQPPWRGNALLALSGIAAFGWTMRRLVAWSKRSGE